MNLEEILIVPSFRGPTARFAQSEHNDVLWLNDCRSEYAVEFPGCLWAVQRRTDGHYRRSRDVPI
uniref:Uncharacterized protein n=1 Tax=Hyaloperonospora arabidopsidis (strain Emoy2) TaxID=559515 RepID=M4BAR3_HYAAE